MTWQKQQQKYSQRVNQSLQQHIEQLPEQSSNLKQAMSYALLMGGKRVRPFLVYATGEMLGAKLEDLDVCAMAIECIHAYSLIHDDLPAMDDDDLRRGHPTCHIAFDEATAILAGDALQTMAFELLISQPLSESVQANRIELLKCLSNAAGYLGMCGGQAMDLSATNKQVDLQELELLHSKKTGALIEAALSMAVLVSQNATSLNMEHLQKYAAAIGLAFQVQDDILDITGNTETLGKPQGSDESLNKSTYPALLGLRGAQQHAQQLLQQALQALATLPYNTQVLASFADYIVNRDH